MFNNNHICKVENCGEYSSIQGMCKRHYHREYSKSHRDRNILYRQRHPERVWASNSLRHHRIVGYVISTTIDEVEILAKETINCIYCGRVLSGKYLQKRTNIQDTPTLDRINNEKELRLDNIQIICAKCNIRKSNNTHKEFMDYCADIYLKFKGGV